MKKTMAKKYFNNFLELPKKIIRLILVFLIQQNESNTSSVLFFDDEKRQKIMETIKEIRKESNLLLVNHEAYQLYMLVKNSEKIKGDIAEVGVYKGGSAAIISEAKGKKTLYLFDTFEGIPKVDKYDSPNFFKGQYSSSLKEVSNYLINYKKYKDIFIYKGIFPNSAPKIKNNKFSFVHLDVDTYKSTKDCLDYFYPRMAKGGIILSHDYLNEHGGVKKAIKDFFNNKKETIVEVSPGYQCLVVKL